MEKLQRLKALLSEKKRIVAFTGAGISAESGIPTYRGDDGVWKKYDPSKYADIGYFLEDPSYYWRFFKDVRYPGLHRAKPNTGHSVLAKLEGGGGLQSVITQNIDGLHQLAGSRNVLELHGNTRRFFCMECGETTGMEDVYKQLEVHLPPACDTCGGLLRPDVVFFGESLDPSVLDTAVRETETCDLFLAIGSSLVVHPAASLPVTAGMHHAAVVIINKDPTPLDSEADLVFRENATEVLETLL